MEAARLRTPGPGYERLEKCRKHRISTRLEAGCGVECEWSPKCGLDP